MNEVQENTSKVEAINIVNGIDKEGHSADEERNIQVVTEKNNNTARNRDNVRTGNNLGSTSAAPAPPCAACSLMDRSCGPECIIAPFFPYNRMKEYECVTEIFGSTEIEKILRRFETENDRRRATDCLLWEAQCWLQYCSTSPFDEYMKLHIYCKSLEHQLSKSHSQTYKLLTDCELLRCELAVLNLGVDVHNNRNVNFLNDNYGIGNGGEDYYASMNTGFGAAGGGGRHNLINNRQICPNNATPIMRPQQLGQFSNFHSLYAGRIPAAGGGNGGSHTLMNNFGDGQLNSQNWSHNNCHWTNPIMHTQQNRRHETDVGRYSNSHSRYPGRIPAAGSGQSNSQNWSHNRANPIMPRQETDVRRNLQCQNSYHPCQSTRVGIRASGSGYDGSGALMTPAMQPQQHGNQEIDELLMEVFNLTQSSQYPNSHPQ